MADCPKKNQRSFLNLSKSAFWGWLPVESQPQNSDFRNNTEKFHPCVYKLEPKTIWSFQKKFHPTVHKLEHRQKLLQRWYWQDSLEKQCVFVLILYVPVNNFSVMSGCVLGCTNTKQRIKGLVQGHGAAPLVCHKPTTPLSRVKHSTTAQETCPNPFGGGFKTSADTGNGRSLIQN